MQPNLLCFQGRPQLLKGRFGPRRYLARVRAVLLAYHEHDAGLAVD